MRTARNTALIIARQQADTFRWMEKCPQDGIEREILEGTVKVIMRERQKQLLLLLISLGESVIAERVREILNKQNTPPQNPDNVWDEIARDIEGE